MRHYELMFLADPRLSDEEFVGMADEYRKMITGGGGTVVGEESWGKRKLAFPIDKLNEGRYMLFYVQTEPGKNPLAEVEHRMNQNDKILRYLSVRTDGRRPPEEREPRREQAGVEG